MANKRYKIIVPIGDSFFQYQTSAFNWRHDNVLDFIDEYGKKVFISGNFVVQEN